MTDVRWRHSPSVAYVETADRAALLDLDSPLHPPVVLEGPAAVIWNVVEDPLDEVSIISEVADRFGVPPEEVGRDIRTFLEDLLAQSLVVRETLP